MKNSSKYNKDHKALFHKLVAALFICLLVFSSIMMSACGSSNESAATEPSIPSSGLTVDEVETPFKIIYSDLTFSTVDSEDGGSFVYDDKDAAAFPIIISGTYDKNKEVNFIEIKNYESSIEKIQEIISDSERVGNLLTKNPMQQNLFELKVTNSMLQLSFLEALAKPDSDENSGESSNEDNVSYKDIICFGKVEEINGWKLSARIDSSEKALVVTAKYY